MVAGSGSVSMSTTSSSTIDSATVPPLFYGVHGYRYYNGGIFGSTVPMGSSVSASGTTRGIFGGAGESAHSGGGAGE
jgi:hypothetical protein